MGMTRTPYFSTRNTQKGAFTALAAVGLGVVIAAGLLAVDLGNIAFTKRDLQMVADNAALSAANNVPSATAIALNSAEANGFPVGGDTGNSLSVEPGSYDFEINTFTPGGDRSGLLNAVQVTVSKQVQFFFGAGSTALSATATAAQSNVAGISAGSGVASIDASQSPLLDALLGSLLKTSLKLDVSTYNGLAAASVSLLDLVKANGTVGSVQELLNLDLGVAELIRLIAQALSQDTLLAANAKLVGELLDLSSRVPNNLHLKLAELLDVSQSPDSAANANINVLELITLAAEVANGDSFLNVPLVNLNLPPLAKLDLRLSMIEPPSIAVGPPGQNADGQWRTQVHTAQWRLKLDLTLLEKLDGAVVHLPLYLEVASANAQLADIACASPLEDSVATVNAQSGIVTAYVGNVNPDAMTNKSSAATVTPAKIVDLKLLFLPLLGIVASGQIEVPSSSQTLAFQGPFGSENTQRISGLSTSGLFSSLGSSVTLTPSILGIELSLLNRLLSGLSALLTPVFALLDSLLNPVLDMLGIDLGFADINVFRLNCSAPQLVR